MERTWTGLLKRGADAEHEHFVVWLDSQEGRALLARSLLSSYRLAEERGRLTVTLVAPEPPPIIRFLRNPRFWPSFWEFESADPGLAVGPEARERVLWRR